MAPIAIMQSPLIIKWSALSALLAVLVLFGVFTVMSLLTSGYDSVNQSLSDLTAERTRYSAVSRTAVILFGFLIIPLSYAVYRIAGSKLYGRLGAALLTISGLLAVTSGAFPDDKQAVVLLGVTADDIHDYTAHLSALALELLILVVIRSTWAMPKWSGFSRFSIAIALIAGVFGTLYQFLLWQQVDGLLERFTVGAVTLWLTVLAIKVLRLPVRDMEAGRPSTD